MLFAWANTSSNVYVSKTKLKQAIVNARATISFVVLIISLMTLRVANGQEQKWFVAGGVTYCSFVNNPGINISVTYRLADDLYIGPDFSAILTKVEKSNGTSRKQKELEYNFNAHYTFEFTPAISAYPLTGINFSKVTLHERGHEPQKQFITAFNIGCGAEFKVREITWFAEGKHVSQFDKYDVTVGAIIAF